MPDKLLEWKSASLRSGVSSFGFSGTNGHGLLEAALTPAEGRAVKPVRFGRKVLKPWREWMPKIVYVEEWVRSAAAMSSTPQGQALVFTDSSLADPLISVLPNSCMLAELGTAAAIGEKMKGASGAGVAVFARCLEPSRADPLPGSHLEELLAFLQGAILAELPKLLVVTRGAYDANRASFDAGASIWGLIRSARLEMPRVTIKTVDVAVDAGPEDIAAAVAAELKGPDGDVEVAYTDQGRCIPRLAEAANEALAMQRQDAMRDSDSASEVKKGVQVVTGGLGGLGASAAGYWSTELGCLALSVPHQAWWLQSSSRRLGHRACSPARVSPAMWTLLLLAARSSAHLAQWPRAGRRLSGGQVNPDLVSCHILHMYYII